MKIPLLFLIGITAITALGTAGHGQVSYLSQIHSATQQFQQFEAAEVAGYHFMAGQDTCNHGLGGAGYSYINIGLVDTTIDIAHPEALIYIPDPNGTWQLGGVEYIVPVASWNASHKSEWPQLMNQQFHLNSALGLYVLHVWSGKANPSGMFEDWNPTVACF